MFIAWQFTNSRSVGATCAYIALLRSATNYGVASYKHLAPPEQKTSTASCGAKNILLLRSNSRLLKLLQKPDVVLEEQSNVVKLIHQRAHAIDP